MFEITMEDILAEENINRAVNIVAANKRVPGYDGMLAEEVRDYWDEHKEKIIESLYDGKYMPDPVKMFFLYKRGRKKRKIGIHTMMDKIVQHAILAKLGTIYEEKFSDNSYGFRKGRNTYQALEQCCKYMNDGYQDIVDLDIKEFFDTIDRNVLIEILDDDIEDKRIVRLIEKFMNCYVTIDGVCARTLQGVTQGGPLSPLLANIVLDRLDKYMSEHNIKFVRYADDMILFCKNRALAEAAFYKAEKFIEDELRLKLNKQKSKIVTPDKLTYLGYSFVKMDKEYVLSINQETKDKMLNKINRYTNSPLIQVEYWDRLGSFNRGWVQYYKKADAEELISFLDEADNEEMRLVNNRFATMVNEEKKEQIYWSIVESNQFITLKDSYRHICLDENGGYNG